MYFSKNNCKYIKRNKLKVSPLLISKTKFLFTIALITSLAFSCSGEDGTDGVNGLQGEQGIAGLNGADGNANVKAGTVNLTNTDWLCCENYRVSNSVTVSLSYHSRYLDLDIPEITQSIIDNGLVLVYFRPDSDYDGWDPLPFRSNSSFSDVITEIRAQSSLEKIRLFYFWSTVGVPGDDVSDHPIADYTFKYIVIEGEAIASRNASEKNTDSKQSIKNKLTEAGIDITNYDEVIDYYGISLE